MTTRSTRPWVPGGRGPWFGVAAVAGLLGLAMLMGVVRGREVPSVHEADAELASFTPMPRAATPAQGPDWGDLSATQAAANAQVASDTRWAAAMTAADRAWPSVSQPLPPEALNVLKEARQPRGMAFAYGIAMTNAARIQDELGIRDVYSRHAAKADAARRVALVTALRRQQACLAGIDMGAVYGESVLTAVRASALLDLGLVRGDRDHSLDPAFLRGARSGRPEVCRMFSPGD